MTFTAYIWCFVHNFIWPCDLDLRPFDIGSVWRIKSLTHQTHIPVFSTLRLSIPELRVTQSEAPLRSFDILAPYKLAYYYYYYYHITITWNAHCACVVSRDLSLWAKNDPHFWNPWPQSTYSLCHFQGATTKIKLFYMRKIAFPIVKAKKFTAHAQYHVTCAQGVPKTTRNIFLIPTYLFTIQLLWGYDDD